MSCCHHIDDETTPLNVDTPRDEEPVHGDPHDHDHAGREDVSLSVLQFTAGLYFCTEDEGQMSLDVARFGDTSGRAEVSFKTEESSAKAGHKFEHISGRLVFEPGESMKQINITILENVTYDSTLEFGVHLFKVSGAQLGRYLNHCRIKILDDDCFPTNKYIDKMKSKNYEAIPKLGLLWEFFKMLWTDTVIRRDSIKAMFCDLSKGLYFFFCIYLQMYLIDVVLNPSGDADDETRERELEGRFLLQGIHASARFLARALEEDDDADEAEEGGFSILPEQLLVPGHRRRTAVVVGILYIVPFFIMHRVDQIKCFLCIPADARKVLQTNLLRKFTHYKEEDRLKAQSSEITMVLIRDVREVIDKGFMKFFEVLRISEKLGLAFIFVIFENWRAIIPLAIYPIVLVPFLLCRQDKIMDVCDKQAIAEDDMVQHISEAVINFPLIRDFHIRPMTIDGFENSIHEYHRLEKEMRSAVRMNWYAARWLSTLIIGSFFMLGGIFVKSFGGPVSLGVFLATVNVFKEVGTEVEEIYSEIMEIQRSLTPLVKISKYLNCETDLDSRMKINRIRRSVIKHRTSEKNDGYVVLASAEPDSSELVQARQAAVAEKSQTTVLSDTSMLPNETFVIDHVAIEIKGLRLDYEGKHVFHSPINVQFEQGQMYCLVGPSRQGKATIMKLLAQVILPGEESEDCLGSIFVPPHLRVLHVSHGSFFLSKSLAENILLGMPLKKAGGKDRILKICEQLEFSSDLMEMLAAQLDYMNYASSTRNLAVPEDVGKAKSSDRDSFDSRWMRAFSHTDSFRLNLARAFVTNPEVMVIHRPTVNFDDKFAENVLKMFRRHVDDRGLAMPQKMFKFRRPRTLFYTTCGKVGMDIPDKIFKVSSLGVFQTDPHEAFDYCVTDTAVSTVSKGRLESGTSFNWRMSESGAFDPKLLNQGSFC